MTKTKPFAELAAKVKADPIRRERIETAKRAIKDALALAELRLRQEMTQKEMAQILGVTQKPTSLVSSTKRISISRRCANISARWALNWK